MLEFSFIRKLVVLIVLTSFVSVNLHLVAGQNTGHYQVQIENNYHGDSLNLRHITSTLTSDVETFEICGRGENGGDGCLSVNPSHHYFRVVDQSENHIGNQHHVVIENTGMHSWLRLQVDLCWSHNMVSVPIMDNEGATVVEYQTTHNLLCKDEGTIYEGEKMVLPVFFMRSDIYFVKVTGIPGDRDDRTTIKVSATLVANSNLDRVEPEPIVPDQRYKRKVCQNECEDGNEDPVDVFSVYSHEGDTLKFKFGHEVIKVYVKTGGLNQTSIRFNFTGEKNEEWPPTRTQSPSTWTNRNVANRTPLNIGWERPATCGFTSWPREIQRTNDPLHTLWR